MVYFYHIGKLFKLMAYFYHIDKLFKLMVYFSKSKSWNIMDLVILISKTNTSRNLDMQIGQQLKDNTCRAQ